MLPSRLLNKPISLALDSRKVAAPYVSFIRGLLGESDLGANWVLLKPWDATSPLNKVTSCVRIPTHIKEEEIQVVQELNEENVESDIKGITVVGR